MSGTRAKALKRELIYLLGRAPRKAEWDAPGIQSRKDEFRVYKKAYMATRHVRHAR